MVLLDLRVCVVVSSSSASGEEAAADGGGGRDGDAPVGAAAAQGRAAGGAVLRGGARFQRKRLHAPLGRAPVGAAQARGHAHQRQVRLPLRDLVVVFVLLFVTVRCWGRRRRSDQAAFCRNGTTFYEFYLFDEMRMWSTRFWSDAVNVGAGI